MARPRGIKVTNDLTRGLVTEATALNFPENAATETDNCIFDAISIVSRRPGIDYEVGYTKENLTKANTDAYNEFLWTAVAGRGNISFVVQQKGDTLYFYDVSTTTVPSSHRKSFTVTLSSFKPSGSGFDNTIEPVSFAQGDGKLFVANKYLNPFYVVYDPDADSISTTQITIKYRDFDGLSDGLNLTDRPTFNVGTLKTGNPEHYYNLLNQGWWAGNTAASTSGVDTADGLAQWDTARTDMPSNADFLPYFRGSSTDIFDNSRVNQYGAGNRPAPKGHFILELSNVQRTAAMIAEGFTGAVITGESTNIAPSGTNSNGGTVNNANNAFDSDTSEAAAGNVAGVVGSSSWLGKTYSSAKRITKATVYGTTDAGYTTAGVTTTIQLYGSNSAPASATNGTLLGSITFVELANESTGRDITNANQSTAYKYYWIKHDQAGTAKVVELQLYQVGSDVSYYRPSCLAFFAGRVWFAGPQDGKLASNIYFSQIGTSDDQWGKCYQKNDPTREDNTDLLADDGGVIRIPELANIVRLYPFQSSLLVLCTNGIWLIKGTSGNGFAANDYQVRKLSSIGADSPLAVVDAKGIPLWWAQDGIYTINYDANYDSYAVESVTLTTIDTFYNSIPIIAKKYAKAAYSIFDNQIMWLYSSNSNPTSSDYYIYDKVLVFNVRSKSFYSWTIPTTNPRVRGLVYVVDPTSSTTAVMKFATAETIDTTHHYWTYSDFHDTTHYKDWYTYDTTGVDYTSYFITGYAIHGETEKYFQDNYIYVFLNTETNSSCFVQAIWDFTNSSDTGKWSTPQQIYNSSLTNRNVNNRRLKIRGKGKACQLKFYSETGKPFNIIGFSTNESVNQDI